jgi:predicted phage baseplate assembly protein
VRATATAHARLLWAGVNCTNVTQRAHVANEPLPAGTGEPDQVVILAKTPVLPASVRLTVTTQETVEVWQEIDDLTSAGPEVPMPDPRQPPGTPPIAGGLVKVFALNPEAGEIRFGDGQRGARPPFGAVLRADYDYGVGPQGNVNTGAINSGPAPPAGFKVTNPVATWGGAAAETVSAGEKQIALYLQHRDRLVNVADFETIARRTPGIDIGRVDVLPAFNPELGGNDPGDAPGAVTLLVIPQYDPLHPDTPEPNKQFIDAICDYIDARRLVTTEVFIRGPLYKPLWISAGISVVAGYSIAEVREAVRQALLQFLAPLPSDPDELLDLQVASSIAPSGAEMSRGWPLRKPVMGLELMAVASRTPGVLLVSGVLVAEGLGPPQSVIDMRGLQLPRVAGIAVTVGEPLAVDQLRGTGTVPVTGGAGEPGGTGVTPQLVPVPVIPDECK